MAELQPMEVKIKPSNVQWEYFLKVLRDGDKVNLEILDELGLRGWELVNVTPETKNSHPVAYLKRIKETAES